MKYPEDKSRSHGARVSARAGTRAPHGRHRDRDAGPAVVRWLAYCRGALRIAQRPLRVCLFVLVMTVLPGSGFAAQYRIDLAGDHSASGTLTFSGDRAVDGTFPLVASDLAGFDLTIPIAGTTYAVSETDFNFAFGGDYVISSGDLVRIDLQTFPLGLTACPACEMQIGNFTPGFAGNNWYINGAPRLDGTYTLTPVPLPATAGLFATALGFFARSRGRRRVGAAAVARIRALIVLIDAARRANLRRATHVHGDN